MNENNVAKPIKPQESPSVENQSSQNTPSSIGQKGNTLLIVGIIFLVAIIGVGAYFLGATKNVKPTQAPQSTLTVQPTPTFFPQDETANWETYVNSNNNFSIKYPKDAKYIDVYDPSSNRPKTWIVDFELYRKLNSDALAQLFIHNFDNPDSLSAKDYFLQHQKETIEYSKKNNVPPPPEVVEEKQIKIGGIDAYSVLLNPHNAPIVSNTYIAGGNKTIMIEHSLEIVQNDPKTEEHTRIFNLMISTFKFLKQSQTSNQTYLYLARKSVFLHNTENVGTQGTEKTGGAPVNIVIPLPTPVLIQTLINQDRQQKSSVTINGSEFWINVFGNPNDGCAPSCTGTDSTFDVNGVHVDTLRILKDNRGVLDINPQTVIVNNYSIPYFTIQKNKPNNVFTNSEVNLWMDLLGKIKTIPANQ